MISIFTSGYFACTASMKRSVSIYGAIKVTASCAFVDACSFFDACSAFPQPLSAAAAPSVSSTTPNMVFAFILCSPLNDKMYVNSECSSQKGSSCKTTGAPSISSDIYI